MDGVEKAVLALERALKMICAADWAGNRPGHLRPVPRYQVTFSHQLPTCQTPSRQCVSRHRPSRHRPSRRRSAVASEVSAEHTHTTVFTLSCFTSVSVVCEVTFWAHVCV